nr:hypothetical protein [Tanacetum cinerariifolium]
MKFRSRYGNGDEVVKVSNGFEAVVKSEEVVVCSSFLHVIGEDLAYCFRVGKRKTILLSGLYCTNDLAFLNPHSLSLDPSKGKKVRHSIVDTLTYWLYQANRLLALFKNQMFVKKSNVTSVQDVTYSISRAVSGNISRAFVFQKTLVKTCSKFRHHKI